MKSAAVDNFDVLIPKKENLTPDEVANILGKTQRWITQLCRDGSFFFYDDDGKYHEGSFKSGSHWRIKRQGIIAYLERSNQ